MPSNVVSKLFIGRKLYLLRLLLGGVPGCYFYDLLVSFNLLLEPESTRISLHLYLKWSLFYGYNLFG